MPMQRQYATEQDSQPSTHSEHTRLPKTVKPTAITSGTFANEYKPSKPEIRRAAHRQLGRSTEVASGSRLIWEKPIYRFVIPETGLKKTIFKEIFIDVTRSAPNIKVGKELSETFDWALSFVGDTKATVLDLGAGKLRSTLYLLNRGNTVTAVEFEKLAKSEQKKGNLVLAKRFGKRFNELIFPHEFFKSELRFDLIILINVLSIMPVPSERLLVLKYCREKLNDDGLILWFSQTTQSFYSDKTNALGDGITLNMDDRYKTFYKDFKVDEIDEIFAASGLRLKEKRVVPHVTARLYKPVGGNPLQSVLDGKIIRTHVKGDIDYPKPATAKLQVLTEAKGRSQVNIPNPYELTASVLYEKALDKLKIGKKEEKTYQNLVGAIFARLFMPPLKNMEFETDIKEGLGRVDIVFRNSAEDGFFRNLRESYRIRCPFVYVECKNIEADLGPEEFQQMLDRFHVTKSHFGIITCRRNKNRRKVVQHAKERTDEQNIVMWLEDTDLITLMKNADDKEKVNDIMEERVEEICLA